MVGSHGLRGPGRYREDHSSSLAACGRPSVGDVLLKSGLRPPPSSLLAQSLKPLKKRDHCKGVCGCRVAGAAKAWLVCCIPADTMKPITCSVTLELTMSSLEHHGHEPSTTSDSMRCSTPYAPAAVKFCEEVRACVHAWVRADVGLLWAACAPCHVVLLPLRGLWMRTVPGVWLKEGGSPSREQGCRQRRRCR